MASPFSARPRALDVHLHELARRVLDRARRPMRFDVAFVRIGAAVGDGRVVAVEPAESSLSTEASTTLRLDPSRARPEAERTAVQQRLDARDRDQKMRSFAGYPARAGDVDVVPVLRFDAEAFDEQPTLRAAIIQDGYARCRNLLEGVAWTLLLDATRALGGSGGIDTSYDQLSRDPEDVLRSAGRLMMIAAGRVAGHPQALFGLFDEINEIASLRYEGRDPWGGLTVARVDHPSIARELVFKIPVPLEEAAWARKVLELSSESSRLLTDSRCIHALGRVLPDYEQACEDLFVVEFGGHQVWELRHAATTLMRVAYGIPMLPEEPLDLAGFSAALRAEFGELPESSTARIWAVVRKALTEKSGALVVVAENAEAEGARLANQGVPIEPTLLSDVTAPQVTSIDGAVLLDTAGLCHAVGVILDGRARSEVGNPARGARYNSAARYVDAADKSALAVVVSEDGTVDLVRRGGSTARAEPPEPRGDTLNGG